MDLTDPLVAEPEVADASPPSVRAKLPSRAERALLDLARAVRDLNLFPSEQFHIGRHFACIAHALIPDRARLAEFADMWLTEAGFDRAEFDKRTQEYMVRTMIERYFPNAEVEIMSAEDLPAAEPEVEDGTSGQDRESYTDDQDRESYMVEAEEEARPFA